MDDAETIFQGALKNHTNMIRQFKGMTRNIGKKVYVYFSPFAAVSLGKVPGLVNRPFLSDLSGFYVSSDSVLP